MKWQLRVREPRGGQLVTVIDHGFETLAGALDCVSHRFTSLSGKPAAWSLLAEGNGPAIGFYGCAWPFFIDLIAPAGTDCFALLGEVA